MRRFHFDGFFCFVLCFLSKECGATFTDENGSFQTPGYPNQYPTNIECEWVITVPVTHSLTLTFNKFDMEESSKCKYDHVEIRDGDKASSNLIGLYKCDKHCCARLKLSMVKHIAIYRPTFPKLQRTHVSVSMYD